MFCHACSLSFAAEAVLLFFRKICMLSAYAAIRISASSAVKYIDRAFFPSVSMVTRLICAPLIRALCILVRALNLGLKQLRVDWTTCYQPFWNRIFRVGQFGVTQPWVSFFTLSFLNRLPEIGPRFVNLYPTHPENNRINKVIHSILGMIPSVSWTHFVTVPVFLRLAHAGLQFCFCFDSF